MDIQYGIKITTAQTTVTDYSIGCIAGVIRWITGRPAVDQWKEGIITKDSFSDVSKEIEISSGGSYGTMSGCSLSIDNASDIAFLIRSLGLNLIQADAIFYTFRDGTATQDWTGKVADWSFDENEIKIQLMDSFRGIHKPILKRVFSGDEFSNVPDSIKGKPIPVTIGRASKSKLYPIVQEQTYETICTASAVNYDKAPCTAYGFTGAAAYAVYTLTLKTVDKTFTSNQLAGKYLSAIKGGSESVLIRSNAASSSGTTVITLDAPLSATPVFWAATGADVWYFQISALVVTFLASQNPIYQYKDNADGNETLYAYDSSSKAYDDVSEIGDEFSLTDIESTGYPGFTILSKPANIDGTIHYQKTAVLSSITELTETVSNAGAVTGTRPTPNAGTDLPNLRDQDPATNYTWIWASTGSPAYVSIPFKIPINQSWITSNFTNIYFAFNHRLEIDNFTRFIVYINVKLYDYLGRLTAALDTTDREILNETGSVWDASDSFIPAIYGTGFSSTLFENVKASLALNYSGASNITKESDAEIYPYVVFEVKYGVQIGVGVANVTATIKECTIIGEKELNILTDNIYSDVYGELFGTTWGARKTAANPVANIADAAELIIRNFDGNSTAINTAAFDILSHPSTGTRKNWNIGRQITDEANSFDLIQDLCVFGMFGMVPKNDGTRAIVDWLNGSVVATHDESNIVQGSIGPRVPTSLSNLYNDMQVNYAWNPETNKAGLVLKICKIDEDSFPLEATVDGNGVDLWKSYAIGYNDDEYAQAKINWDYCHASYLEYGVIQPLPSSMADAKWFPDIETDWAVASTGNAAKLYMTALCAWAPFRKDVITYRLPNTSTHATLELLDKITFNDTVMTDGGNVNGWIIKKAITPGEGRDYIEISLMLEVIAS